MPPRHRLALVAILLIAALLGALRLNRFTSAYDDEARFLMLAESLRFQGRYDLFDGMEHQFPPGLPALFAAAMWLTGTGQPLDTAILPAKIAVFLLHLLALALLYDLLARAGPPWVALATVLALAVSPLLTSLATEPMSDVPFVAAAILTLWLLDRAAQAPPPRLIWLWAAFAGLAAGLAWNIRLVGAVLVAVGGLYLLMSRRWLAAGVFVGLALFCLAPWLLYNRFDPIQRAETTTDTTLSAAGYLSAATSVDLYEPTASASTLADYLGRLRFNTRTSVLALSAVLLGQPWRRLPVGPFPGWSGKLDAGFGLLLAGFILLGLLVGLRRRQWLPLLYLAGMQAVVLIWPFFQQRYLLPLLPFYFFYLFLGLDWLKQQARHPSLTPSIHRSTHQPINRSTNLGLAFFAGGIILFLAAANLSAGLHLFSLRHAPTVAAYYRSQNAAWASYFESAHWLAENTPPAAIIAARKPYLVYLFDNRRAVAFPWSSAAADWRSYLAQNNVSYIIEDSFSWSDVTDRFLRPVLRADPGAFHLVYTSPPPATRIWRFVGEDVGK